MSFQELIGAPAGKLHTGRSRNDQVCFYKTRAVFSRRLPRVSHEIIHYWRLSGIMSLYFMCLHSPGCDRHEAVAARRHLNPDRQCSAAYIYHGRAGSSVSQTHTDTHKHSRLLVNVLLKLDSWGLLWPCCDPQRNWSAFSWLHPHAESSANQMEPLDPQVITLKK